MHGESGALSLGVGGCSMELHQRRLRWVIGKGSSPEGSGHGTDPWRTGSTGTLSHRVWVVLCTARCCARGSRVGPFRLGMFCDYVEIQQHL